jgi:hypothetical protein
MLNPWRRVCWNALHNTAAGFGFGIASYRQPERLSAFVAVRRAKHNREMLLTPLEAAELSSLVRATAKLEGAMAEVGVFRGASAGLMHETDPGRALHLFDTFQGLPEPAQTDTEFRNGQFVKGQFACALDEVKDYLGPSDSIFYHQGLFPDSAEAVKQERFSLVHADVDLYTSTRSVLEFFYPRLVPGGVILSHDFHSCQGPHRAISEFFVNKPEPIIELPGDQAVIVKV